MKKFLKGKSFQRDNSSHTTGINESISIHSGREKKITRTIKWPEEHNVVFGELLLEQSLIGNMPNGVLKKGLWCDLVETLNRRLQSNYTELMVMIRFKNMKADFRILYMLANRSGWGWDDDLNMPVASDEIWEEILKDNPELGRYRRNLFHQYSVFEKICADNIAMGFGARHTRNIPRSKQVEEDFVDQSNDEFMCGNGVSFQVDSEIPITQTEDTEAINNSKRSSDGVEASGRRKKKNKGKGKLQKLMDKQFETASMFKESFSKHAPYSLVECLNKLKDIKNLSTEALIVMHDYLKESNDNKVTFMTWEGPVLFRWIEYIMECHPKLYGYSA